MKQHNLEKVTEKVFGGIRLFVAKYIKKNEKRISSRLDSLLVEKANEQGIQVSLKRPASVLRTLTLLFGTGLALTGVIVLVLFVPGPWTRFFARPQIVTMTMLNLDATINGIVSEKPRIIIQSPKAVRGVQFLKANLSITPNVPLNIEWNATTNEIAVTPQVALQPGTVYTVTLAPGVLFNDGTYLVNEQSWVIPTKAVFDVVSISPRDRSEVPPTAAIEISFTTDEFTLESITPHIQISPSVAGTYKKVDSRVVFAPKNSLGVGASYSVTISSEAKDNQGNAIPKAYTTTFVVRQSDDYSGTEILPPAINTDFSVYNMSKGNANINFASNNISKVNISAYSVMWEEALPYVNELIQKGTFAPAKLAVNKKSVYSSKATGARVEGTQEYYFQHSFESLKSGIFLIKIESSSDPAVTSYMFFFKSETGIYATTRANKTDLDSWSFDYATKKPLAGVTLTVTGCTASGCTSVQDVSGKDGYSRINSTRRVSYVLAKLGDSAQLLFPGLNYFSGSGFSSYDTRDINLYTKVITNKPQYLPGSQLNYTVLVREKVGGDFKKIVANKSYEAYLCPDSLDYGYADLNNFGTKCIYKKTVKTDKNSQIEGSFSLWKRPEDLNLYIVEKKNGESAIVASEYIIISEIDKPQIVMQVKTNKARYVGAETAKVSGRVTDYVGAGIPNKQVRIEGRVDSYKVANDSFALDEVTVRTDAKGNFVASIPLPVDKMEVFQGEVFFDVRTLDGDNSVTGYAKANWDKGEAVTATVMVNGKEAVDTVPLGNKPTIQLLVESLPDRKPKKDKALRVRVERSYSIEVLSEPTYDEETREMVSNKNYETKTEEVYNKEVTSSASGKVSFELPAVKEGTYELMISDQEGAWHVAQRGSLFDAGETNGFVGYDTINEWIRDVWFDGERANVGDKVPFHLTSTFKKTKQQLVMFIRTTEITSWQYISQNTTSIDIPITKDMVGGVEVCVLHPMSAYGFDSKENPVSLGGAMQLACDYLLVENKEQKLTVKAIPSASEVLPGKESPLTIEVQNSQGVGESAIVGVTVVDKALYDAMYAKEYVESAYLNLYESQFGTVTNNADHGILSIDAMYLIGAYGGQGSGGGDNTGSIRKDFSDNPYWKGSAETDAQGKITLPVTYSDGITTWLVTVWAVTDDYKVGSKVIEVRTKKDVYIDLDRPARLRVGDEWYPYIRITNDTATSFNGTVSVQCNGCLEKPLSLSVSIRPFETYEKLLQMKVTKLENVSLEAKVTRNGALIDGIVYPLEVHSIGFEIPFVTQKRITKESKNVGFSIPEGGATVLSTASLEISALPLVVEDALVMGAQNAKTLEVAGALANLATLNQYKSFGNGRLSQEDAVAQAREYLSVLLSRLQSNGAFSFHSYGGVDYDATTSSAYALAEAKAGFGATLELDEKVILQVAEYLRSAILSDKVSLTQKMQMAYVYSRLDAKRATSVVMGLLSSVKEAELSKTQRAYLALSLFQVNATADATRILLKQEVANKTDVPSGDYVSGDQSEVTTAIQAYLITKLGIWAERKAPLEKYQAWLLNSCVSCLNAYNRTLVGSLLTGSLVPTQIGSYAGEDVTVTLNGKKLGAYSYDGNRFVLGLNPTAFVAGNNVISIETASGRALFATLSGLIYQTKFPANQSEAKAGVTISWKGMGSSKSMKAGENGYYSVKVTALQDLPISRIAMYLPTSLSSEPWAYIDGFYRYVTDNDALFAYGDSTRGDAFSAEIQPLKNGESQIIVLPFMAKQLGIFSGEIVQFSIPSDANFQQVVKGSAVTVN